MLRRLLLTGDIGPFDPLSHLTFGTAPTTTARVAPPGRKLEDGKGPTRATLAFASDPNVNLWEIEVGVPGFDNGDAIDTTTQWNSTWRTFAARVLFTLTEFTVVGAYDPALLTEILALKGVEMAMTLHFPDDSTYDFFAFIRTMEFDAMTEGTMPRATLTIQPTNTDPATGAEEGPVLTSSAGT